MIILQFGGNALPYIKTKEQADNFGLYLKVQIATIKKLAPQASVLVIGPADMSVKEGADYVTHPQLENLRDAIKKTAFEYDCAFFDMYNCLCILALLVCAASLSSRKSYRSVAEFQNFRMPSKV